jgi:hypothetical protein
LPQPPVLAPGEGANGRFAEWIAIRPDAKTGTKLAMSRN